MMASVLLQWKPARFAVSGSARDARRERDSRTRRRRVAP